MDDTTRLNFLMVAGDFGPAPRASGYASKLYLSLLKAMPEALTTRIHNGGTFEDLEALLKVVHLYDVIFWFANVPNDQPKLVDQIKVLSPEAILVTSKNNLDGRYCIHTLIARALKVKANLLVEFTSFGGQVAASVLDPLGNTFNKPNVDIDTVAKTLAFRAVELSGYTRIGSSSLGPETLEVPDEAEFFEVAKNHAEIFHKLIHAVDTDRFLGNLSFRCERGFPSFREGKDYYVSRRNVDKRSIGREGFVRVSSEFSEPEAGELKVLYHGDHKPSVDTPVQVTLYNMFPNVRYMMHAHVYVVGAPMTDKVIPCGALEEVQEIAALVFPDFVRTDFAINLRGHGSIVFASHVGFFREVQYQPRTFPEPQYLF